jgi:hypothetical protein
VELKAQPYIVLLTEKTHLKQAQAAYLAGANDFIATRLNLEGLRYLASASRKFRNKRSCLTSSPTWIHWSRIDAT